MIIFIGCLLLSVAGSHHTIPFVLQVFLLYGDEIVILNIVHVKKPRISREKTLTLWKTYKALWIATSNEDTAETSKSVMIWSKYITCWRSAEFIEAVFCFCRIMSFSLQLVSVIASKNSKEKLILSLPHYLCFKYFVDIIWNYLLYWTHDLWYLSPHHIYIMITATEIKFAITSNQWDFQPFSSEYKLLSNFVQGFLLCPFKVTTMDNFCSRDILLINKNMIIICQNKFLLICVFYFHQIELFDIFTSDFLMFVSVKLFL